MPKCGIVVATFNQLVYTKVCLQSIWKYTDASVPILVIDNNSTDGTQEWLREAKDAHHITDLIIYKENTYLPIALNDGMKWCIERGLDYCFVSNDMVVGKGWLEELIKGTYSHPSIGGSSPFISPEATYDNYCNMEFRDMYKRQYWYKALNNPSVEELWKMLDDIHDGSFDEFTTNWVETRKDDLPLYEWFSMLRYLKKETIEKVGLFDEQFVPTHWEDMDYMCRMNLFNMFRISVTPSYAFHWGMITHRSGLPGEDEKQRIGRIENEVRFHKKWKVFLPQNEQRHDIEDGDKYPSIIQPMPVCPFPVADAEHNRKHGRYSLWSSELYPNIPQPGNKLWKEIYGE